MGSVVGEKIARAADYAIDHNLPLMIISKSGGARMMEGAFSLDPGDLSSSGGLCSQRRGRWCPRQRFLELAGQPARWKQADGCLPPGAMRCLVVNLERAPKAVNHHPVRPKAKRLPRTGRRNTARRPPPLLYWITGRAPSKTRVIGAFGG